MQFDIPLREPLVPDRRATIRRAYAPEGRPDGKPWTHTPPVTFDQPLDIDLTPDTVVIAGHGAGVHPNLAALPTVAEPTAPPAANPLHPFALRLLRPQQVIMLGRPTLHRPVSALLADPSVPVFALTTGPRWPDVSGNSQATGTRAVTTGEPNPAWLHRCAEVNRHADRGGPRPARGPPADHRPARGGGGGRRGPARRSAGARRVEPGPRRRAGGAATQRGVKVRSNRGVAGIDGTVSTAIGAALAHDRTGGAPSR